MVHLRSTPKRFHQWCIDQTLRLSSRRPRRVTRKGPARDQRAARRLQIQFFVSPFTNFLTLFENAINRARDDVDWASNLHVFSPLPTHRAKHDVSTQPK